MHRKLPPSSAPDAQSERQEGSRGLLRFVRVHLQSASALSGQHLWYALVILSLRAVPLLHALPSCMQPEPGGTSHVAHRMAQAAQAARLGDLATLTREDLRYFLLGVALAAAARLCCSALAWAAHPDADVKVDHSDCTPLLCSAAVFTGSASSIRLACAATRSTTGRRSVETDHRGRSGGRRRRGGLQRGQPEKLAEGEACRVASSCNAEVSHHVTHAIQSQQRQSCPRARAWASGARQA